MQINILGIVSRLFPISQEVVIFLQKHQKENFMAGRLGGNAILSCNTLILMKYWCPGAESKFLVFIAFWAIRLDLRTNRRANETLIPPLKRIEVALIYKPPGGISASLNCYSTNLDLLKSILKKIANQWVQSCL